MSELSESTAFSRLSHSEHVRPLSQQSTGYLQAVLPNFTLTREKDGLRLGLTIADDPMTLIDGRGKRDLESVTRQRGVAGRSELQQQLDLFYSNPNLREHHFDCANWPMRFANGGVLPIIQMKNRDYFLMFYRDIFPIGWNIANGASDNTDEWLDPGRIILREFCEEVLIFDPIARRFLVCDPPSSARPFPAREMALAAWSARRPEFTDFDRVSLPIKWIGGPDSVEVHFAGRQQHTHDVFLSIMPEDHGIEVDRFALIRLDENAHFLCGEVTGDKLLNQIVGLFDVERLQGLVSGDEFHPDFFFFDGQRYEGDSLVKIVPKFLADVRDSGLRREDQVKFYQEANLLLNLCPITRAIIGRYFQWRVSGEVFHHAE